MKRLEFPRSSTIANDSYVGLAGEFTIDIDRWEIRLHDGETPGGHRICNLDQLYELFMSKDSEFGQVVFAEDARGVLTRIGDRQYALRSLIGYNGIHVTEDATHDVANPAGTAADFYIGLDPDDLATLLLGLATGKFLYAGLSTGTADALAITVPAGWKNDQGSIVSFKAHVDLHDAVTLQVTVGSTPGGVLPIISTSGSNKMSQLIKKNTVVLLERIDRIDTGNDNSLVGDDDQILTGYRIINMLTAKELGIAPISGMTATNVQDALAELKAALGGGGGDDSGNDNSFWNFANFNQPAQNAHTPTENIPIADGERRLIRIVTTNGTSHSGGSSGDTIGTTTTGSVMGVTVAGSPENKVFMAQREGLKIWIGQVFPARHASDSKYRIGSKDHIGDVLLADTSFKTGGGNQIGGASHTWTYSDVGTVAT